MIRQKKTHSKKKGAIRPGLVITSLLLAVSIGVTGTAVYFKDIVNLFTETPAQRHIWQKNFSKFSAFRSFGKRRWKRQRRRVSFCLTGYRKREAYS